MQKILLSTWRNYRGRNLQDKEVVDASHEKQFSEQKISKPKYLNIIHIKIHYTYQNLLELSF